MDAAEDSLSLTQCKFVVVIDAKYTGEDKLQNTQMLASNLRNWLSHANECTECPAWLTYVDIEQPHEIDIIVSPDAQLSASIYMTFSHFTDEVHKPNIQKAALKEELRPFLHTHFPKFNVTKKNVKN